MQKMRVRPRTRETVLKDEYGRDVPYENADGSLGVLVDDNSPFWARRLRDKDAVRVSDDDNKAAVGRRSTQLAETSKQPPAAEGDAGKRSK